MFFLLAFVCLLQLIMCIVAEWQRMKAPSLLRACQVTTQKVLYFVVFLASIIRGAYFTSPVSIIYIHNKNIDNKQENIVKRNFQLKLTI